MICLTPKIPGVYHNWCGCSVTAWNERLLLVFWVFLFLCEHHWSVCAALPHHCCPLEGYQTENHFQSQQLLLALAVLLLWAWKTWFVARLTPWKPGLASFAMFLSNRWGKYHCQVTVQQTESIITVNHEYSCGRKSRNVYVVHTRQDYY